MSSAARTNLAKALPLHITVRVERGLIKQTRLSYIPGGSLTCEISPCEPSICDTILAWLECYAQRKTTFPTLPLEKYTGLFSFDILEILKTIPFGTTQSYSEIARSAGSPKASRAAGSACGTNPCPLFIPCHRVVRANGNLGGFTGDLRIKKLLLDFERIR